MSRGSKLTFSIWYQACACPDVSQLSLGDGVALFLRAQLNYCIIQVPCCTWLIIERHKIAIPSPFYESSACRNGSCDVNKHVLFRTTWSWAICSPTTTEVDQARFNIRVNCIVWNHFFDCSSSISPHTRPTVRLLLFFYQSDFDFTNIPGLCVHSTRVAFHCAHHFFFIIHMICFLQTRVSARSSPTLYCHFSVEGPTLTTLRNACVTLVFVLCGWLYCEPAKILWTFSRRFEAVLSSRRLPVRCSHVPLHLPTPVKPFVEGAALRLTWCSSDMLRAFGGEKPARLARFAALCMVEKFEKN